MTTKTTWANRIIGHGLERPDQLLANPRNWRIHPKAQQDALGGLLDKVGWVQDVIVNQRTGHVVDGHLRVSLAISRQEPEIPVVYVDLAPEEEALVLASLDPLAAMAVTDEAMLAELMMDVSADGALADMLDALSGNKAKAGNTDPDAVPPTPDEPTTKPGDLWLLGEHRLLCGDATSAADHSRLIGEASIDLVLTDPPYGIEVAYESFDDAKANLPALVDGFMPLIQRWPRILLTPGIANIWLYPQADWVLSWAEAAGVGSGPWGFTCWQPILAYGADPFLAEGKGRHPDTYFGVGEGASSKDHPVAKPMDTWTWVLERGSIHSGQTILDPFLGSGTTLIACERLGRRCYAMEIEPRYVDVAVRRWEEFTGQTAVLSE